MDAAIVGAATSVETDAIMHFLQFGIAPSYHHSRMVNEAVWIAVGTRDYDSGSRQ